MAHIPHDPDVGDPDDKRARVDYRGLRLSRTLFVAHRIGESSSRCDCGAAPEHAPDCSWLRAAEDFDRDFVSMWHAQEDERRDRAVTAVAQALVHLEAELRAAKLAVAQHLAAIRNEDVDALRFVSAAVRAHLSKFTPWADDVHARALELG